MWPTDALRALVSAHPRNFRCGLALAAGLLASAAAAAPEHFVHEGVAVDFSIVAATGESRAREAEAARVRFSITDTTTGQPVRRLHPAAWLSRRDARTGLQPRTCAEKVQELLGGSIFSKADLDLNSFLVVALNDDASLTVVDPLFGFGGTKLIAMIKLPGVGADWALTADDKKLFVTIPAINQIAVIDTATWTVASLLDTGPTPGRVGVQPDGHYAWTADSTGVTAIEVGPGAIAARIPMGGGTRDVVFSADSRWVFVTNPTHRTLSVIDVRTLTKVRDVPLDCAPVGTAYSSTSDAVYLTDETGGNILVVDAKQHEIVARIAAEAGVGEIRFAPGDRFAVVANPARDLVLVVDAATNRVVQRAKIENEPEQFAFSSDMIFVRRRGTATIGMIPLKDLGRDGQAVPVAEFPGGAAAFGVRSSRAAGVVSAPGETAVVVANPADKAIYYYMEGMAAPMGNFSNYGRRPRAVLVVDRSLREVAPGVYETAADLPAAGDYDAVFFLDAPRIAHCFAATIQPDPNRPRPIAPEARLEAVARTETAFIAKRPARLSFRVRFAKAESGAVLAPPTDLTLRAILAPGTWHARLTPTFAADGMCAVEFTPPSAGLYYFYAESVSLGLALSQPPCLVLRVAELPTPDAK